MVKSEAKVKASKPAGELTAKAKRQQRVDEAKAEAQPQPVIQMVLNRATRRSLRRSITRRAKWLATRTGAQLARFERKRQAQLTAARERAKAQREAAERIELMGKKLAEPVKRMDVTKLPGYGENTAASREAARRILKAGEKV